MKLPIVDYKSRILETLKKNDITIVVGETGSGKTTQLPKYASEQYRQVIVTEPRIMAAKTAAQRVAEEMNVTLGEEVGYQTGYDKCCSSDSKIIFCTDGLQLVRTLTKESGRKEERILVIDEVHEFNLNIETLISWCKYMRNVWNTKVVIMSATMDAESMKKFFDNNAAIINIPGTLYNVTMEQRSKRSLVPTIAEKVGENKNILAFLPGKREIEEVINQVRELVPYAVILPLHAEMDWEDQKKCFADYNVPKVIVATNVAQTSLTIPGIDVVVDSGEAKISIAENGIQGIFIKAISKADCLQRKGRAGRTKEGEYILCSDIPFENRADFTVPEIQRSLLDRVVLQLSAAGLDAEVLEFYHQPDRYAIRDAKKVLRILGALDDNNNITELGKKMVKMPVSVQLARMIVEAEKYGVTKQVMTIAAIVEMGGLLYKGKVSKVDLEGDPFWVPACYSDFTKEENSDLLAELDVWNHINKLGYIDFKKLGINKKVFFKVKEHIKKMEAALSGIVDIQSGDDRDAIMRSCLAGLMANVFVSDTYETFSSDDGYDRKIDRNSCVDNSYNTLVVVGYPKTIEFLNRWKEKCRMHLISFVTRINNEMVPELFPNEIQKDVSTSYDAYDDAVSVTEKVYFRGVMVLDKTHSDKNHPEYAVLKAEYEAEQARIEAQREAERQRELYWYEEYRRSSAYSSFGSSSYGGSSYSEPEKPKTEERQKSVVIDGKSFDVYYDYNGDPSIRLDDRTIFTTEQNVVRLDNGIQVILKAESMWSRKEKSIAGLRNAMELSRLAEIRKCRKAGYDRKVTTFDDLLFEIQMETIGPVEIAKDKGGYGTEPIYMYGCLTLKKNTVSMELLDDEERATANTKEALQYLFMKEVEKRYPIGCFSAQTGKKKKILTPSENEVKMKFDSLVREMLQELTTSNLEESMEFVEEYFQELTQNLKKAS